MNLYKVVVLFSVLLFGANSKIIQSNDTIKHTVKIHHPGIGLTNSVKKALIQIKGKGDEADEFYMDVKTVVCGDSQCRIDTIRIFWNELGFYDRLVLPAGVVLEKAEGEHFSSEDYQKLDKILANKNCSLKEVYKKELVGRETTEGIDGISGATIIIHNDDYVKGAVWTCYTLWHWVNGKVFSIIRNITGDDRSTEELHAFLKQTALKPKIFALEQLIRHKNYQAETLSLVLQQGTTEDYQLHKLILQYLEYAPHDYYASSFKTLLKNVIPHQRQLYLSTLLKTHQQLPKPFFETISLQLPTWQDYPSIHLFLKILEEKATVSPAILQAIFPLLDNKNFIVARRAYWFLNEQKLSERQAERLKVFQVENKERL